MGLLKVGKIRLSKSGKALEVELDKLPYTTFTLHLYAPKTRVQKILEQKILETDISLLVGDQRNMSGENKALQG